MKGRLTFLQLQEKRALTLFTGKWVMGFYLGLPLVLRPKISLSAVVRCPLIGFPSVNRSEGGWGGGSNSTTHTSLLPFPSEV